MEELERHELEELESLLLKRKAELEQHLKASSDSSKPVDLGEPIGRLSRVDALQAQQLARAKRSRDEATLKMINAALARIERGEYGLCLGCEEPIGLPRLRAKPEATLCVRCRAATE